MAGSSRKGGHGATPATQALDAAGVAYRTLSYHHDASTPSYGLEAAEKLGVPEEAVFQDTHGVAGEPSCGGYGSGCCHA